MMSSSCWGAAVPPLLLLLVEEGGVAEHPIGLVEVRGRSLPVLLVYLEPDGPPTRIFADQTRRPILWELVLGEY